MRKKNGFFVITVVFAVLLLSLTGCASKEKTIVILSTNDIHGQIDNFPKLAAMVEECRMQDTATVVLVDAGDRWTGNPYVDMAPESGQPIIEMMDSLGYDAATFGNHEFDRGLKILNDRVADASFDIVLANIHSEGTPLEQPAPYVIKNFDGVKIGFLGLITNFINGHPDGDDDVFAGTTFDSPFSTAERYASLRDSCDVLVVLSHLGSDADSVLVDYIPTLDLIVGGHTHTVIDNGIRLGNTVLTQTGKNLKSVGVTTIKLRKRKIVSIDNRLVSLSDFEPDPKYTAMLERYHDNPEMKKSVVELTADMSKEAAANLFTEMIRNEMKTDLSLYHYGGVRTDGFKAGELTKADVYATEPFMSVAYRVTMTPDQLKELILNKYNDTQNPKESHSRDIFPGGFAYTIVTDSAGECIDVEFRFPKTKSAYSVAVADYMYKMYDFDKPEVEEQSRLLTDIMIDYLSSRPTYTPDDSEHVEITNSGAE